MDLGNSGDTYDRRDHTSIQTEILYELSPSWQIDNLTTRDHTVLLGTYQTKPDIHAKGKKETEGEGRMEGEGGGETEMQDVKG